MNLLIILCRYEICFLQILQTFLYALHYIWSAVLFYFGYNRLYTCLFDMLEDGIISYHTALTYFAVVFDM